jgi:CSLREA domain-containing protein
MRKAKLISSFAALALSVVVLLPASASAGTIDVTTINDEFNTGASCSLREAVQTANTDANFGGCTDAAPGTATDTIGLAPGSEGSYALTIPKDGSPDDNADGDLDFTAGGGTTILQGGVHPLNFLVTSIDGSAIDRVVHLTSDSSGAAKVALHDVTLFHGAVPGTEDGGGILSEDPDAQLELLGVRIAVNDAGGDGGGIAFVNGGTSARLSITRSTIDINNADGDGGGLYLDVADISDPNDPSVERTTFVNNTAGEMGGGIYIKTRLVDGPQLFLRNSTLSNNDGAIGGGGLAFDQAEGGNAYFNFVTLTENSTPFPGQGGGIYTSGTDQFMVFNGTIIARNTAGGADSNCVGSAGIADLGYNLSSSAGCGLTDPTDLLNANPMLAPLDFNAAPSVEPPSPTMGLFDGSPALDRIPPASCTAANGVDERNVARPINTNCDIGAFEGSVGPVVDWDGDGVLDSVDNCRYGPQLDQANIDGDLLGDVCDPDADGDGLPYPDFALNNPDDCPNLAGPASNHGCPLQASPPGPATTTAPPTFNLAAAIKKCKKKFPGNANAQRRKKCIKKAKRQAGLA